MKLLVKCLFLDCEGVGKGRVRTCFGFHVTVLASEEDLVITFCHSEQKSVYEVYEERRRMLIIDKKGDFNTTAMGEIKVQKCPILLD